jgi:hypothetical protein
MEVDRLESIKHRINAGDREGARLALADLLHSDADNVDAWALLAILFRDPAEQAECYRQILRVDPGNRQAATWLESLMRQIPEPSDREELPKPPGPAGLEGDQAAEGQPWPEVDELAQLMQELNGPDVGDEAKQGLGPDVGITSQEQGIPTVGGRGETRSFLDRLLGRSGRKARKVQSRVVLDEQGYALPQSGALDPGSVLRLAGGPLAPGDRRKCPACGAVVSRTESRCPWCSAHLPDVQKE